MSIGKRSMGVEGFVSSSRPIPTRANLEALAPLEFTSRGKTFKFNSVIELKDTFNFIYEIKGAQGGDKRVFSLKRIRIDEAANQRAFLLSSFLNEA